MSNELQEKIESLEKSVFFLEDERDYWKDLAYHLWEEKRKSENVSKVLDDCVVFLQSENKTLEDRVRELQSSLLPSCLVKSD